MTHTFLISGMTCDSCKAKIENLFGKIEGVQEVKVDLKKGEAQVEMDKHLGLDVFKSVLRVFPKYQISEKEPEILPSFDEEPKNWIQTYKPVLLIFAYITGITMLIQLGNGHFNLMQWMNHFMGAFFLTFSFFKLLNLSGFADSYSTYDIIAKRWRNYSYLYVFVELGLGLAYLLQYNALITNLTTTLVMGISLIGVLQSILDKKRIRCACLGDVFNLPMSTITVVEDGLMLAMSTLMLLSVL